MKKTAPILPGAAIGVLGSGQLSDVAIAARQMGYRVHTLSPDADTPTGQVADVEIKASYEDLDAVRRFAKRVAVVTFEFENIPFATAEAAGRYAPVRPSGDILHTTQHRLREKTFLAKNGFPVAPFHVIRTVSDLIPALKELGPQTVLKTAGFGYDGKGQRKITSADSAHAAFKDLGNKECVLEAFIDFDYEMSVVAARGMDGAFVHYGVIRNDHVNHILDVSSAPGAVPEKWSRQAIAITREVMEKLQVVGVMCVEFFLTKTGPVINELAPRPHNSGHLTVDACITSQFEQQLRAVCGLPLGSTAYLQPAAMVNLLGDLWMPNEPRWTEALKNPAVKLHLYGKLAPRPGRKMGHLTAVAPTAEMARRQALAARRALKK